VSDPATLSAVCILASLVLYALFGGADFGGGVWDLLARGPGAGDRRRLSVAFCPSPPLLLPVVAGLILLWKYREDLFGTDVPIRIATALLLAAVGWRFARDLGRAVGPRLMRRFDPGTASTVSFLVQLIALLVLIVVALRIVDLNPRAIALGGAVTAVVIGLAAQSTLGNVIAGIVLQTSRPFRVGERVRMQGGTLGAVVEGTVASQGLIYVTLARGNGIFLVPNNAALGATIVPLRVGLRRMEEFEF